MIYVPSDALDTAGGIPDADITRLANRKLDSNGRIGLQNYFNVAGGGLVALTEDGASDPYAWLELPDPFTIETAFGTDLTQTPLLAAAGFNITDQELSNGTPWHNSFVGPPGFNRLQVWVIDPISGRVVTLGSGAGQGGIGTRNSAPQPGDWRSIKLDDFSNDTNVDVVNEIEQGFAPTGDTNSLPSTAQFLGDLAKDTKSGDDNARLGFEIHGSISQTVTSPNGGDVDVYSFRGTAGTIVWFDIDRTAPALGYGRRVGRRQRRRGGAVRQLAGRANQPRIADRHRPADAWRLCRHSRAVYQSRLLLDQSARRRHAADPAGHGRHGQHLLRARAGRAAPICRALNGGLTKGKYVDADSPAKPRRVPGLDRAQRRHSLCHDRRRSDRQARAFAPAGRHGQLELAPRQYLRLRRILATCWPATSNEISVAGSLAAATSVDWLSSISTTTWSSRSAPAASRHLPRCSASTMPTAWCGPIRRFRSSIKTATWS